MAKRKHAQISRANDGSPVSQTGQDSTYGTQSPAVAECPFTIEYPPRASTVAKGKKRKSSGKDIDTSSEKTEEDVPSKTMQVAYVIRPGTLWESMRRYRNFVVGDETFGVNDYIFVNQSNIAPGTVLTIEDEKLFWTARVLEVRALDSQHVYLRIFWMYWPDELPGGAKPYHGKHEVIASNYMEIIDAMTVAGKAKVSHWLEKDEEPVLDALYWRQTFNFQSRVLSSLRKHCTCHNYYNPDKTLIGCSHPDCNLWMHEQCVIDDTLSRAYQRLGGDPSNDEPTKLPKKTRRKSSQAKLTSTHVWDGLFSATIIPRAAETETSDAKESDDPKSPDNELTSPPNDTTPPSASADSKDSSDSEAQTDNSHKSAGKLLVTDLRSTGVAGDDNDDGDGDGDADADRKKTWEEDIVCLGCRRKIK